MHSTYVDTDAASESLYYNAEQGQGDFQVARAVTDDCTNEQNVMFSFMCTCLAFNLH